MVAQVGPSWTVEQHLALERYSMVKLDSFTLTLPLELIYEDSGL